MTEDIYTWITVGKLFTIAIAGSLYSMAGGGWKIPILGKIRRSVWLPIILALQWLGFGALQHVLSLWLVLGCLATIPFAYGLYKAFAYGSSSWVRKLVGRKTQQFIVGAVHGFALSILPCIVLALAGKPVWGLLIGSIVLPSIGLGLYGGLFDNDLEAAKKEGVTGALEYIVPVFII